MRLNVKEFFIPHPRRGFGSLTPAQRAVITVDLTPLVGCGLLPDPSVMALDQCLIEALGFLEAKLQTVFEFTE